MRVAALPLLGALGVLAACASESPPVSSSAPTVSYRIAGNDVSQANADAARYCRQYGASPQLQGIQQGPSGNVAVYSCGGGPGSSAGMTAAPYVGPGYYAQPGYAQPGYGSTVAPVQCADAMHQDRPGGLDYRGPPVLQCPQR
jgi:hypothetical protein